MARDRAARPEARPLRLFVAVDVPVEVRGQVRAAMEPFRDLVPRARWTRDEGWHVTLKFLGATWPRLVPAVHEAVASVAAGSTAFVTGPTVVGCFPGPTRARVLWVGLEDPSARFGQMVKLLDESLVADFKPEKRAFTPHLTLARLNPPANLRDLDLVGMAVGAGSFEVGELILYRSHLSPKGATYDVLGRFPLAPGRDA